MSTAHIREAQKLDPDALVELYTLDTTMLTNIYGQPGAGDVLLFCSGALGGSPVVFNGLTYTPMPIEASGFEWNGQGKLPRPKLKIANISGLAAGLTYQFTDLLGAEVTRLRTFRKFLDGMPEADPTAVFEPDVFRVDRKSHQSKAYVEFELAAAFDQQNVRLPKRQVLRDSCGFTYRVYSAGSFHYGTCPYTGGPMYDAFDAGTTDPTKDQCSHRLTGCVARYGQTATKPFAGFPGVAQVRTG